MSHKHEPAIPFPLETLMTRLRDLEAVLGPGAAPALEAVQDTLAGALAARDRGDVPGAIDRIGQAMDRLTALAERLDPAEAVLMRALAHNFRTALHRGDDSEAKRHAQVMFEKSGAVERKKC